MSQKKNFSEDDTSAKFITPALYQAGWDEAAIRRQVAFTAGRIIVRGKLVTRGKAKRADYVLYYQHFPIALIEAKHNFRARATACRRRRVCRRPQPPRHLYLPQGCI